MLASYRVMGLNSTCFPVTHSPGVFFSPYIPLNATNSCVRASPSVCLLSFHPSGRMCLEINAHIQKIAASRLTSRHCYHGNNSSQLQFEKATASTYCQITPFFSHTINMIALNHTNVHPPTPLARPVSWELEQVHRLSV